MELISNKLTTFDVISRLCGDNPDISMLTIAEFGRQKDVHAEVDGWTDNDQRLYDFALKIRSEYSLPFWKGIMLGMTNVGAESYSCMDAVVRHNANRLYLVSVSDFSNLEIKDNIGINSHVVMSDGSSRHIVMLDFHIRYSERNTDVVRHIVSLLYGDGGYILNSGHSYHFIGKKAVDIDRLIDILARAQMFDPITDGIWLSHQLLERSCTLRLGVKHDIIPYVVCEI